MRIFVCNRHLCGTVMFLHLSAILFKGGLADTPPGRNPRVDTPLGRPPAPRRPLQRTVRILLECILVPIDVHKRCDPSVSSNKWVTTLGKLHPPVVTPFVYAFAILRKTPPGARINVKFKLLSAEYNPPLLKQNVRCVKFRIFFRNCRLKNEKNLCFIQT